MTPGSAWLGASLALPLAMLLACLSGRWRASMSRGLVVAPLPALGAALFASGASLKLPPLLLGFALLLDTPAALLLGAASLLWVGAGWYADAWLRDRPDPGRFTVWWLLTLTGSIGVFMAADLAGFYLMFTLVSLAAYGLVIDGGTLEVRRIGLIYVAFAILGEAFLLLAFVMLVVAAPGVHTMIREAVAALPTSPLRNATLVLLVLGFGVKLGLVPLQSWMPLTYRAAPIPAAVVLSGAGVKAGVVGLLHFLPFHAAWPGWGETLTTIGLISAFYGVVAGIAQSNPKAVLGYSSISQMGVITAVLGIGLGSGNEGVALLVACYAVNHTLVKGGLFVAVGVAQADAGRRMWSLLLPATVLALGLGGLPLTGGWLAKLAVKPVLGSGVVGLLGSLSSAGTTLLMIHFLVRLAAVPAACPARSMLAVLRLTWLGLALASVVVPWIVVVTLLPGALTNAVSLGSLAEAGWPVLVGGLLAAALSPWRHRMVGWDRADAIVLRTTDTAARLGCEIGKSTEKLDLLLRRWPVAAILLLNLAALLAALMLVTG
ncbi:MAG TPA: complex I subunit 5 family protein [Acetobacteraceae bacterium]|nr:complex I subunit 5 family protein [Acetobacteraceae bacterium]